MYKKYYNKIFKIIYSKIGNKAESEELTQETFIKVFKNLECYDNNRGDFSNFLFSNCKQVIADYYKVKIPRKEKVEEVELDERIKAELNLEYESKYDIENIIESLPDE